MDRIENILRQFQPVAASEEIWERAIRGLAPRRRREVLARRLIMSVAILAVVGVLFYILTSPHASTRGLSQESPGRTLRRIEEALEKAGTVRVRFRVAVFYPDPHKREGFLLIKKGGKVHGMVQRVDGKEEGKVTVVSDGSRLACRSVEDWTAEALPNGFYGGVEVALARLGASHAASLGAGWHHVVWHPDGCEKTLEVSDIQAETPEGNAQVISYTVQVRGTNYDTKSHVRLWYEPRTLRPLKRTIKTIASLQSKDGIHERRGEYTETYEEYALDTEISDDQFRIPVGK